MTDYTHEFSIQRSERHGHRTVELPIPEGTAGFRMRFSYSPRYVKGAEAEEQVAEALAQYMAGLPQHRWCPAVVLDETARHAQAAVKMFTPLRNQLNVSLYDPIGNCWGRWDSTKFFGQWLEVGTQSGWGFASGYLNPGTWQLEVESYGVFSPVLQCQMELQWIPFTARRWYAGETHSHSRHSDGAGSPQELFQAAADTGLDFLILSDHNTISGWADIDGHTPLLVIPGQELTTFFGHAVVAGTQQYVDWRTEGREASLNQAAAAARNMGGIFTIAHPFMVGEPLCCGCRWEYQSTDFQLVDAMEIWSGSWSKNALFNWLAVQWWDELLSQGHTVTGVAARDIHQLDQLRLDDAANTRVLAWDCRAEAIIDGIRQGRVCVSPRGTVEITASAAEAEPEAKAAIMGGAVTVQPGQQLRIKVTIENLPEPGHLEVVAEGNVIASQTVEAGDHNLYLEIPAPAHYLRVQVVRPADDRAPLMFSNPIYVQK